MPSNETQVAAATPDPAPNAGPIYCVKCRTKTANTDPERVTMRNGRAAIRAKCADCGTNKNRIGG